VIVTGANLSFAASHRYEASHERSERLRTWTGVRPPEPADEASPLVPLRQMVAALQRPTPPASDYETGVLARQARQHGAKAEAEQDELAGLDPAQRRILLLLEKLFGIKGIKQFDLELDYSSVQQVQAVASQATALQSGPQGWGLEYDYHESYQEYEATSLALAGTFTTEDDRAFSFDISYQMERSYQRTTDISVRAGDAVVKDPLILDLGQGGNISSIKKEFDLDRDGWVDLLPRLQGASRYLAADFNRNGKIDDGGELFGPTSGDGFADLAAHDDDGNGFIDQGDAIWDLLRLWSGDDAEPALLAQWKIAAIGLQRIEAPFSYKDADNTLLGQNRSAGVYLTDDGQAGVVKQVDLVV
jgi:hypothetical protein